VAAETEGEDNTDVDVETREETKEEAGENNSQQYALKGQKLLAQGNTLGLYINNKVAL
jgi:hypothetical protein